MRFYFKLDRDAKEYDVTTSFTLGRRQGDLLFPHDNLISAAHLRIYVENKQAFLEDLGSSNGTWLNDDRVPPKEPKLLQGGDIIKLGSSTLCFLRDAPDEELDQDRTRVEAMPAAFAEEDNDRTRILPQNLSSKDKTPVKFVPAAQERDTAIFTPPENLPLEELDVEESSGRSKIVIERVLMGCVVAGLGLLLWTQNKKRTDPVPQRTVAKVKIEKKEEAPAPIVQAKPVAPAPVPKPEPVVALPSPPPEVVKVSAPQIREVPLMPESIVKKTPTKASHLPKVSKKSKPQIKFLARLDALKKQYKNANSQRVKQALLLDAQEVVIEHYRVERSLVVQKFKQSRSPASVAQKEAQTQLKRLKAQEARQIDDLPDFLKNPR